MARRRLRLALLLVLLLGAALAAGYLALPREVLLAAYATPLKDRTPAQRANALRAAAALDGAVLQPGQTLSFNGRVGSTTKDRGYLKAAVSYDGELVPSFGGGVCQTSTTLYNAALEAGLDIVERHCHVWPPRYAPLGADAAVAYPTYDLVIRNPFAHPARLAIGLEAGQLRCSVYSSRPLHETYQVQRRVTALEPWPKVRQLGHLGNGSKRRLVRGRPGCSVMTFRLTLVDGQEIERRLIADDAYQPLPEVEQASADPALRQGTPPDVRKP